MTRLTYFLLKAYIIFATQAGYNYSVGICFKQIDILGAIIKSNNQGTHVVLVQSPSSKTCSNTWTHSIWNQLIWVWEEQIASERSTGSWMEMRVFRDLAGGTTSIFRAKWVFSVEIWEVNVSFISEQVFKILSSKQYSKVAMLLCQAVLPQQNHIHKRQFWNITISILK